MKVYQAGNRNGNMRRLRHLAAWTILVGVGFLSGCHTPPNIPDGWMDSQAVNDPTIDHRYIPVSQRKIHNTNQPVWIAVHGFSSSTAELEAFETQATKQGQSVSRILLGGHGRNYEDFKKSTWREWQAPIRNEYDLLVKAGYKDIRIIAVSTGATLVLHWLFSADLKPLPTQIVLIDPYWVPQEKEVLLSPILAPLIPDVSRAEKRNAHGLRTKYNIMPAHALVQLVACTGKAHAAVKWSGIRIDSPITVYQSTRDSVSDPAGTRLLVSQLTETGHDVVLRWVVSPHHVPIDVASIDHPTDGDIQIQKQMIAQILSGRRNNAD
ncbi:hypothetical protein EBR96_05920 [bacterium]|nr:hypothetical protein [bacterium]